MPVLAQVCLLRISGRSHHPARRLLLRRHLGASPHRCLRRTQLRQGRPAQPQRTRRLRRVDSRRRGHANFLILEYACKPPYFENLLQDPLVITDGYFELNDRPGLGVELNEDFAAAQPHHLIARETHWLPDGSVADV